MFVVVRGNAPRNTMNLMNTVSTVYTTCQCSMAERPVARKHRHAHKHPTPGPVALASVKKSGLGFCANDQPLPVASAGRTAASPRPTPRA